MIELILVCIALATFDTQPMLAAVAIGGLALIGAAHAFKRSGEL